MGWWALDRVTIGKWRLFLTVPPFTPLFALAKVGGLLAELTGNGEASAAKDRLTELARPRRLLSRMHTNCGITFLGPAYAMLEIYLVGTVVAPPLIQAELFSEVLVVSCFLFTSFTYLPLLIRDLDNPSQYDGSSRVDADLTPPAASRASLEAASTTAGWASGARWDASMGGPAPRQWIPPLPPPPLPLRGPS